LGVGWDSDPPYYVMEYLENGSLASFLAEGPLPPAEAVRITKSILTALVHAHGSGILHCDLKPANVLLDADFDPRICDFGQSRLSSEQDPALGTLFYMAPEQADMKAIPDSRWDVYAIGAIIYHMLTGDAPHRTDENERRIRSAGTLDERLAVYRKILKQSPKPKDHRKRAGVDERLAEIVDRCLSVDPKKRFPNAQALLDSLEIRDRQRARRPLLTLGVVGPALLLLAMIFVVVHVASSAVEETHTTFTDRAIESDILPAKILARLLKLDLDERKSELERIADAKALDAEFRNLLLERVADDQNLTDELQKRMSDLDVDEGAMTLPDAIRASKGRTWDERKQFFEGLLVAKEKTEKRRKALGHQLDPNRSWFVNDRDGKQLWREPYEVKTVDNNYAWRDYFHGEGEDYEDKDTRPANLEPIIEPHISVPFKSKATNRWMVAVSVPIRDETQEVIGVLARTSHLAQLLDDYSEDIREGSGEDDIQRIVALVDSRNGGLLSHPWMTLDHMKDLDDPTVKKLTVDDTMQGKLDELYEYEQSIALDDNLTRDGDEPQDSDIDLHHLKEYRDPVGKEDFDPVNYGGEWLSAFAMVTGTDWVAIVQERRENALRPIDEMESRIVKIAVVGLLASLALVGVLWYFVWRALNDRGGKFLTSQRLSIRTMGSASTVSER
jgi:hypothetical protein